MAEDWAGAASDILAAIAEVGFDVTFVREVSGPTTAWDTTPRVTGSLVLKAIDRKPRWARLDGASELVSRRGLLVAPGAVMPVSGDLVTVRGVAHQILSVRTVAPGGVDLLHVVELSD